MKDGPQIKTGRTGMYFFDLTLAVLKPRFQLPPPLLFYLGLEIIQKLVLIIFCPPVINQLSIFPLFSVIGHLKVKYCSCKYCK